MSKLYINTNGTGLWSSKARPVRIVDMRLGYVNAEPGDGMPTFGELCVVFDKDTWSVRDDGLIYTDEGFLSELRSVLEERGLPGSDVSYSEQGLQGNDYVSLDVGEDFLRAWGEKYRVTNWTTVAKTYV
jgi:hypothetical protein